MAKFIIDTSAKSRHLIKLTLIHVTNSNRMRGNMKCIQPPPPSVTPLALLLELSLTRLASTWLEPCACVASSHLHLTNNAHMLKVSSSRSFHPKEIVGQLPNSEWAWPIVIGTASCAHICRMPYSDLAAKTAAILTPPCSRACLADLSSVCQMIKSN